MIGQLKPKTASTADDISDRPTSPVRCREQMLQTVNELHTLSRRGLWGVLLFMSLSAVTLYCSESGLFAAAPAGIKDLPAHGVKWHKKGDARINDIARWK